MKRLLKRCRQWLEEFALGGTVYDETSTTTQNEITQASNVLHSQHPIQTAQDPQYIDTRPVDLS